MGLNSVTTWPTFSLYD